MPPLNVSTIKLTENTHWTKGLNFLTIDVDRSLPC